ncbi:hypothetical protein GCM10023149_40170 [Mucilaginibacter gynuensis]|uniref:Uncharacterized protein n=1 Tax=Mucilaginibacter gynuensis TaxID=1302236 RepID=A0ABP8H2A9_9SPHI
MIKGIKYPENDLGTPFPKDIQVKNSDQRDDEYAEVYVTP